MAQWVLAFWWNLDCTRTPSSVVVIERSNEIRIQNKDKTIFDILTLLLKNVFPAFLMISTVTMTISSLSHMYLKIVTTE